MHEIDVRSCRQTGCKIRGDGLIVEALTFAQLLDLRWPTSPAPRSAHLPRCAPNLLGSALLCLATEATAVQQACSPSRSGQWSLPAPLDEQQRLCLEAKHQPGLPLQPGELPCPLGSVCGHLNCVRLRILCASQPDLKVSACGGRCVLEALLSVHKQTLQGMVACVFGRQSKSCNSEWLTNVLLDGEATLQLSNL